MAADPTQTPTTNWRPATKFPTPDREGYFWAKLIHPSSMPDGEDWQSLDWEVVQVNDNNGDGDEKFSVSVPGISPPQWIPDFVWGPEVVRPKEISRVR